MILPKILILIPVWKRPEITKICFNGLDRLREHRSLDVLAVISEVEYIDLCNDHKVDHTFFENQPLGRKKNHGLKVALESDWDYLIEINSDDLISNKLIDIYDSCTDDYLALRNFCFVDSVTLEVRQVESATAYGIGRRYSRKAVEACKVTKVNVLKSCICGSGSLAQGTQVDIKPDIAKDLERCGYVEIMDEGIRLWNDIASAGMDNFSNLRLMDNGFRCKQIFTDEPLAADIKSDTNIWKWNPDAGVSYSFEDLKKELPELDGLKNSNRINI